MSTWCSCSRAAAFLLVVLAIALAVFSDVTDGGIRRYWPRPSFTAKDIPDLHGRVFLVTGANTGIGKETAIELGRKGATVILGCRTPCDTLAKEIDALGGKGTSLKLDLSDAYSIYEFSKRVKELNSPLHVLVLNAGVMAKADFDTTRDGFEMQLGVNWIGHFFLNLLLQDLVEASAPSRVVIVSAKAYDVIGSLPPLEESILDTSASRAAYNPVRNYALSKVLNILHARELAKRMKAAGKKVSVLSLHPGVIQTDLSRHVFDTVARYIGEGASRRLFAVAFSMFMSAHEGALTQLYAATSPEVVEKDLNGAYLRPLVRIEHVSRVAGDDANAKRAWKEALNISRNLMRKLEPGSCTSDQNAEADNCRSNLQFWPQYD